MLVAVELVVAVLLVLPSFDHFVGHLGSGQFVVHPGLDRLVVHWSCNQIFGQAVA